MERRKFIAATAGIATTTILAGCSGTEDNTDDPTDTPNGTDNETDTPGNETDPDTEEPPEEEQLDATPVQTPATNLTLTPELLGSGWSINEGPTVNSGEESQFPEDDVAQAAQVILASEGGSGFLMNNVIVFKDTETASNMYSNQTEQFSEDSDAVNRYAEPEFTDKATAVIRANGDGGTTVAIQKDNVVGLVISTLTEGGGTGTETNSTETETTAESGDSTDQFNAAIGYAETLFNSWSFAE